MSREVQRHEHHTLIGLNTTLAAAITLELKFNIPPTLQSTSRPQSSDSWGHKQSLQTQHVSDSPT